MHHPFLKELRWIFQDGQWFEYSMMNIFFPKKSSAQTGFEPVASFDVAKTHYSRLSKN